MKVKLTVLIVDDVPLYANRIQEVIVEENKLSEYFEYVPVVFMGEGCFLLAKEYIQANGEKIDLIFSDYNLGAGGNGIDLFNLFSQCNAKPYKILHSNTSQRLDEHSEEFKLGLFDSFSKSKKEPDIKSKLLWATDNIFRLRLFGNPNFYKKYYDRGFVENSLVISKVGEIKLIDILSINTINDLHTFIYRNHSENRISIKSWQITGTKYRQNSIIEMADGLPFARVNQSQTVNLLWVSEFDLKNKQVVFISPDSIHRSLEVINVSDDKKFIQTYESFASIVSANIPDFFL